MTLKQKLAQAQQINQLKIEMAAYDDAVKGGNKFSKYYETKSAAIKAKIESIST